VPVVQVIPLFAPELADTISGFDPNRILDILLLAALADHEHEPPYRALAQEEQSEHEMSDLEAKLPGAANSLLKAVLQAMSQPFWHASVSDRRAAYRRHARLTLAMDRCTGSWARDRHPFTIRAGPHPQLAGVRSPAPCSSINVTLMSNDWL
jgi:hypothetical protein